MLLWYSIAETRAPLFPSTSEVQESHADRTQWSIGNWKEEFQGIPCSSSVSLYHLIGHQLREISGHIVGVKKGPR